MQQSGAFYWTPFSLAEPIKSFAFKSRLVPTTHDPRPLVKLHNRPDITIVLKDKHQWLMLPPAVPLRNRKIAEFLKEKKLGEGRFTGVQTIYRTMKENKNSKPSFHFNSSYFRVRLPGHQNILPFQNYEKLTTSVLKEKRMMQLSLLKAFWMHTKTRLNIPFQDMNCYSLNSLHFMTITWGTQIWSHTSTSFQRNYRSEFP